MKNLLKYEFRKTWAAKAMVLAATAVAELVFLIGLYLVSGEDVTLIGILLLTVCAFAGIMIIGLQSVVVLHRDMNTKQGYMLYMTPNSSYKTLGAKVLENGLSLLATGVFFFALAALDLTLLFGRFGELERGLKILHQVMEQFGAEFELNTQSFAALTFTMLSSWLCTVCSGFLADVVSSALLNGKKYNGALSFLLFLALSWLTGWIQRLPTYPNYMSAFIWQGVIALACAAGMYLLTAWLMDRYLSV